MTEILAARPDQEEPPVDAPAPASQVLVDAADDPPSAGLPDQPAAEAARRATRGRAPIYPRLLHLQHLRPNAWQRAVLGEGMAVVGGLLAMADLASAWSIVVLPLAVAAVVKGHDVLAGILGTDDAPAADA